MAILCGVGESGMTLYDIPDSELSKYEKKSRPLDDETRNQLFPGKDQPTRDDAQGVIPIGASDGDVQGFAMSAICWVMDEWGNIIYWPC